LAAALVGLVLVSVSAGSAGGPHPMLGVLASIGSGTAYALTTLVGHGLAQRAAPLSLATASTTVGALALAPLTVVTGVGVGLLGVALLLVAGAGLGAAPEAPPPG